MYRFLKASAKEGTIYFGFNNMGETRIPYLTPDEFMGVPADRQADSKEGPRGVPRLLTDIEAEQRKEGAERLLHPEKARKKELKREKIREDALKLVTGLSEIPEEQRERVLEIVRKNPDAQELMEVLAQPGFETAFFRGLFKIVHEIGKAAGIRYELDEEGIMAKVPERVDDSLEKEEAKEVKKEEEPEELNVFKDPYFLIYAAEGGRAIPHEVSDELKLEQCKEGHPVFFVDKESQDIYSLVVEEKTDRTIKGDLKIVQPDGTYGKSEKNVTVQLGDAKSQDTALRPGSEVVIDSANGTKHIQIEELFIVE